MLPILFDLQDFTSIKYKQKSRLFNLHGISKAWHQATYMGGTHRQKKNNIISHKQYHHEFVSLDEHYQANNIEGWDLSGEPTYLVELTKDYHVDIKNTTNVYIQQVAFHAQFNVSVYKACNPDILAPGSTRNTSMDNFSVGS